MLSRWTQRFTDWAASERAPLSVQLWFQLRYPPENSPVFRRALALRGARPLAQWLQGCLVLAAMATGLVPVLVLADTLIGVYWAAQTAHALGEERRNGTLDILGTAPPGLRGSSWLLAVGTVHRNRLFHRLENGGTWVVRLMFVVLGFVALEAVALSAPGRVPDLFSFYAVLTTRVALFTLAVYMDHVQSIAAAVLVGVLTPTLARDRLSAQFGAAGLFLFVQTTVYALGLLLVVGVWPALFGPVRAWGVVPTMFADGLLLAAYVGLREGVNVALWWAAGRRLSRDPLMQTA